jgi:hypothetical protein
MPRIALPAVDKNSSVYSGIKCRKTTIEILVLIELMDPKLIGVAKAADHLES